MHELSLLSFNEDAQVAEILARTGRGTYVRTLAEGLGEVTGAGAYAATLRRTRVGLFSVDEALVPDELNPERYQVRGQSVMALTEALGFLPRHDVVGRDAKLAANGGELRDMPAGRCRVYSEDGLLGIWEGPGGVARSAVVFPAPIREDSA